MSEPTDAQEHKTRPGPPPPGRSKTPLIGAHISTAGGMGLVPHRAVAVGAETVQIFSSNPRTWRARWPEEPELRALTDGLAARGLPLFLHTIYLVNLASPDETLRLRSAGAVAHALVIGAIAGAEGVVTHIGSHRGQGVGSGAGRVVETIRAILDTAGSTLENQGLGAPLPPLLLETGVGAGSIMGARFEELAAVLEPLTAPLRAGSTAAAPPDAGRIGVCLDSAHLFAAGYPVHRPDGLDEVLGRLESLDLLSRVGLVHLNDSAEPFASNRDRHENPGDGRIGYAALARMVRHPALAHIPFVLEVPGTDGHGPDAETVAVAKSMRSAGRRGGRPSRDPVGPRLN